jgi:hypothetical protein
MGLEWDNSRTHPESVQKIPPSLHHAEPFFKVLRPVIGGAYDITRHVAQLPLDGVKASTLLI